MKHLVSPAQRDVREVKHLLWKVFISTQCSFRRRNVVGFFLSILPSSKSHAPTCHAFHLVLHHVPFTCLLPFTRISILARSAANISDLQMKKRPWLSTKNSWVKQFLPLPDFSKQGWPAQLEPPPTPFLTCHFFNFPYWDPKTVAMSDKVAYCHWKTLYLKNSIFLTGSRSDFFPFDFASSEVYSAVREKLIYV